MHISVIRTIGQLAFIACGMRIVVATIYASIIFQIYDQHIEDIYEDSPGAKSINYRQYYYKLYLLI